MDEQPDLKTELTNALVITVIGFGLILMFGARILHALIDFLRWLGMN